MEITLAGSLLDRQPNNSQLSTLSIQLSAFDGEVGQSTVPIPDPVGADEVAPGRLLEIDEGGTVLLAGAIASEGRDRGPEIVGGGKQDTYQVDDPNTFLYGFRVIADRPEETDYARIAWFFSTYLPAADTSFVLNTDTSSMVAASYASNGVADIMRDAIDLTGKTLFVHDKAAGGLCAHWHALTGGHTCGLTIDDTFGSWDQVTTFAPGNPSRVRDGRDLANDILAYGADETMGSVNVTDPTSIATYDVDGKQHQTFANFPATDVATLTADANRLLETNKDPRDTFTVTIGPLDATALALIRVGDIITITSVTLGLSASPQRIAGMRLAVAGGQPAPGLWDATLTIGAPVRGPGRFGRSVARPPSNQMPAIVVPPIVEPTQSFWQFPPLDSAGGDVYFQRLDMVSAPASPAAYEVRLIALTTVGGVPVRADSALFLGFQGTITQVLHIRGIMYTPTSTPPTPPVIRIRYGSWPDQSTLDYDIDSGLKVGNGLGDAEDLGIVYPAGADIRRATIAEVALTVGAMGGSGPYSWPLSGSFTANSVKQLVVETDDARDNIFVNVVDYAEDSSLYPLTSGHPTDWIQYGVADGSTDTITLAPYRPNSVEVTVGGIPWTDGYTELDPATGTIFFTQVPVAGDLVEGENVIRYRLVAA